MTVNKITELANNITDENIEASVVQGFLDNVVARINVTLGATLTSMTDDNVTTTTYQDISDSWQRLLFVSYASYAIKANDGSLNEADRFRSEYETNFRLLEENRFKAIADTYQGTKFGNMYYIKADQGLNVGWFTTRNKGKEGF